MAVCKISVFLLRLLGYVILYMQPRSATDGFSSFIGDPAKGFPYEVLESIDGLNTDQCIWKLHHGKHKSTGQPVSVFVFDVSSNSETVKQVAQASAKRLKTLRHPNILSFLDSLETDKCIYLVTEPVVPLAVHLKECDEASALATSWGLHQTLKGLSFLVNSANMVHNNVCMSSVFVDRAGEWKLGGVDFMYPSKGEGSNVPPIKCPPGLEKYEPPERNNSSAKRQKSHPWSLDMWGLGCLVWETFNGQLPRSSSLKVIGKIPKNLVKNYCELVSANPSLRPSPEKFLEACKMQNGFMNNHFVQTNLFLEEIQIKDAHEVASFFSDLTKYLDDFPKTYSKHKILPQLLNAFQFGNGGPAVLPPLFKLGKLLDATEYQAQIVPCVVKLFSSTDRATRIHLLRQLPLFVEHLQPPVVNSQVFPNMVTGFMDTNPAIREQSVKGMLLLAPKLNDNNLNNELMKHFARLQSRDDQGPIRTNTTVCLGKLTGNLNPATRQKVISSAFTRAMRDPFPAARTAGVLAMCNNVQFFTVKDSATKALPVLCSLSVDPDKQVRDNAFKTIEVFLEKLKTASENQEEAMKMDTAAGAASPSSPQAASGWAGWMTTGVTSITSKLYHTPGTSPDSTRSPQPSSAAPAKEGEAPSQEQQAPPSSAHQEEEEERSDKGEDESGWNDDEDWEGLEDFEYNEAHSAGKPVPGHRGKIVTTRQLRAMEEDIWQDLHVGKKIAQDVDDDGGDDDGGGAWDNSWETNAQPEVEAHREQASAEWGGGWDDDDGWNAEEKTSSRSNNNDMFAAPDHDLTPASAYNWGQTDDNSSPTDFFNEFAPKPKKVVSHRTLKPSSVQSTASKPSPAQSTASKPKTSKPAVKASSNEGGWDDGSWGDDGWGDTDVNQGLSRAERMKAEREEKRRQRQKQMEERKGAKSGPKKLGARKCD